jgi:3-oxoacyl-[acyl-carrier-protein] synthase II
MNETLRSRTRVVVTGLGAITPAGQTVDEFWDNLVHGRSGIAYMTQANPEAFPCKVSGEVRDWEPTKFIERKASRRMARFSQFMVAAAGQAYEDAKLYLDGEDRDRLAVMIGNGGGGYPDIQDGAQTLFERGGMKIDPLYLARSLGNMAAAQVSLQYNLRGYNGTIVTACAAGTQAIGEASMLIRSGRAEVVLTGGCEAGISELGLAGFSVMRAVTSYEGDPTKASRPFDLERDGFVPCEGAGALVLESEAHALARGRASTPRWPGSAARTMPTTSSHPPRMAAAQRAQWRNRCVMRASKQTLWTTSTHTRRARRWAIRRRRRPSSGSLASVPTRYR